MGKVEADMNLMSTIQGESQSLNDYIKLFKAQVDVINANGGRAGYNPELYQEHLQRIRSELSVRTQDEWQALTKERRRETSRAAEKAATEEYLACLLLHNTDRKRYGAVFNRLAEDYVLAKGDKAKRDAVYPKDRVAMQRVLADFGKGAATKSKQNTPAADDGGDIFAIIASTRCCASDSALASRARCWRVGLRLAIGWRLMLGAGLSAAIAAIPASPESPKR